MRVRARQHTFALPRLGSLGGGVRRDAKPSLREPRQESAPVDDCLSARDSMREMMA